MKRTLLVVPLVVVVVLLFAFGFGRNPLVVANPLVRHPAPDFSLRTVSGRPVSFKSLRGRPMVISFFASWCVACREQEGNLVTAFHRWRARVHFLGIVFEDSPSAARSFARSEGATWPDLVDGEGQTAINYGVTGVPETFFVDPKGKIAFHSDSLAERTIRHGIRVALTD